MALDEALLFSAASRTVPPTLRLFRWEPATLSLGYSQSVKDVDLDGLADEGWGLVRRPTGGRAILHTDEITYSVTAPMDDPVLSGSLLDSYCVISRALIATLRELGVNATNDKEYSNGNKSTTLNPVCFETPSNYEITVEGKKLIGSAQARKLGGLLQHGSLPLFGDLTRIIKALKFSDEASRTTAGEKLIARAVTLESVTGNIIDWDSAVNAFKTGFSKSLGVEFTTSDPNKAEVEYALELAANKFNSREWTFRL